MPDLGVYNIATLTGLLGPAKSVVAMTTIVTPERTVDDKGKIKVREEDNAMIIMEHEKGVLSHIECGFNYFDPISPPRLVPSRNLPYAYCRVNRIRRSSLSPVLYLNVRMDRNN